MEETTTSTDTAQVYVIALDDPSGPTYSTLSTFTDPALWNWLHEAVDFDGASSAYVPVPGADRTAYITVGSPANDKAQDLSNNHPLVQHVHTTLETHTLALEKLVGEVGEGNTFRGYWY
ncbi:hypothetical protein LG293_17705 (plasmid) [Citricoccus nitrophenolicus]